VFYHVPNPYTSFSHSEGLCICTSRCVLNTKELLLHEIEPFFCKPACWLRGESISLDWICHLHFIFFLLSMRRKVISTLCVPEGFKPKFEQHATMMKRKKEGLSELAVDKIWKKVSDISNWPFIETDPLSYEHLFLLLLNKIFNFLTRLLLEMVYKLRKGCPDCAKQQKIQKSRFCTSNKNWTNFLYLCWGTLLTPSWHLTTKLKNGFL